MMFWSLFSIHADLAEKMTEKKIKKAICSQTPAKRPLDVINSVEVDSNNQPTIGEVARRMQPVGAVEEARLRASRLNEKNPNR
jgi:hypothetical protein